MEIDGSRPKGHLTLLQVLLLNSVVCGLEFCASAAFTYIPPMLLKAGLSEEHMSWTLGGGPFLGFILVPWIGRHSDNCRSRFGRRRPYILALSTLLIISLIMIPYGEFFGVYAFGPSERTKNLGVIMLIIGAVLLDFTSQATLTPCEALLSDACKNTNQQDRCFMVYSFMVSMGGCVGYLITALDWSGNAVGLYFGSQERSAFSLLIILFSISLFLTLVIAQERPTQVLRPRRSQNNASYAVANGRIDGSDNSIHQALLAHQNNLAGIIPPQDPGYESGDNYAHSDDSSYNAGGPNANELQQNKNVNSMSRSDSKSGTIDSKTGNVVEPLLPLWAQRTLSIPLTKFSVSLSRCDSLCYYLTSRYYRYLPSNFKVLYEMPVVLKRLAVAHFFSWTAVMGFNLYFTDFVGQTVYGGNPNAPEDSPERALFDEGVRMGSWGLLLHCVTSAAYAFFVERLTERFGTKTTYGVGMFTFTLAMAAMVFTTNAVCVTLLAACTGIAYATLTTIPFILITKYHANKEIFFFDCGPEGQVPRRGMGTDMASLDAAYFLSQIVLSAVMSYVVHVTGTVLAYVVCAGGMGAVSCACLHRVIFDKKDLAAMLKR